ncbi:precorrin-6Y C5,15-methyltransferase (decarboxylating) subunit CbiT [Propionibacterium cyclohexanicum]|uniref:precorrin-6Y C5,15-methyltransferase (decarboxylating) subunit CbiT n=1 Tax=Propionibacterium cyclohexanicum TaxID=64702 RepID=UPI000B871004|nr:precorrin-6Y C5,15-methyltransferase (decarboxylating) subunit CbiT [Propionibacterium cyclohexanicum]
MSADPDASLLGRTPGLDEAHYEHDGLITKHAVRAVVLAALRPLPGQLLWDLGAGAGSVGIEWCRTDPRCRAFGVESRPGRAARARINAARLTLPGQLEVVDGTLDEVIESLPRPDAIFIGGGLTEELAQRCLALLGAKDRLVATAVTLEAELVLSHLHMHCGGELLRISVETADRIGPLHGWAPARTITLWAVAAGSGDTPAGAPTTTLRGR